MALFHVCTSCDSKLKVVITSFVVKVWQVWSTSTIPSLLKSARDPVDWLHTKSASKCCTLFRLTIVTFGSTRSVRIYSAVTLRYVTAEYILTLQVLPLDLKMYGMYLVAKCEPTIRVLPMHYAPKCMYVCINTYNHTHIHKLSGRTWSVRAGEECCMLFCLEIVTSWKHTQPLRYVT
jgi:hypothetical protein